MWSTGSGLLEQWVGLVLAAVRKRVVVDALAELLISIASIRVASKLKIAASSINKPVPFLHTLRCFDTARQASLAV
jgi:hypothetical protein